MLDTVTQLVTMSHNSIYYRLRVAVQKLAYITPVWRYTRVTSVITDTHTYHAVVYKLLTAAIAVKRNENRHIV